MSWQEASDMAGAAGEAVYVVAGNDAGMLHVWTALGSGQRTWQPVRTPQQVTVDHGHVTAADGCLTVHASCWRCAQQSNMCFACTQDVPVLCHGPASKGEQFVQMATMNIPVF